MADHPAGRTQSDRIMLTVVRDARSGRPSYGSIEKQVVCRRHWCSGPLVVAGSEIAQRMALAAGLEAGSALTPTATSGLSGMMVTGLPPKWPVGRQRSGSAPMLLIIDGATNWRDIPRLVEMNASLPWQS